MNDKNIELENAIEKKFRNILLERKIMSYILQKDHKVAFFVDEYTFSLEPHQVFLRISRKQEMEYPKNLFWQAVKKEIPSDDFELYTNYVSKIYQVDLENVTSKNIEKLCNQLIELQQSRKLMSTISDVISDVSQFDLQKTKFKLQSVLMNTGISTRDSIDYVKDFSKRRDHLREIAKDPKNLSGIPTGIKEFDDLSGGLQRTEGGIIIAATGAGKSIALGNLGMNGFFKNYNVAIFNFEMPNRETAYRLDSRSAMIEFSKFRKAELDIFEYERWEKKMQAYEERKKNFLRIEYFERGSTVADIKSAAYKIQDEENQKLDLLIIDYLALISANKFHGKDRGWEAQTDIAWELKELYQTFNDGLGLAMWTAGQLTDDGIKAKKITTSHLKYARGVSEAMPVIVALNQSEEAKLQQITEMWVIKCRNFAKQNKPIILYPNFKYMQMDDQSRRKDSDT